MGQRGSVTTDLARAGLVLGDFSNSILIFNGDYIGEFLFIFFCFKRDMLFQFFQSYSRKYNIHKNTSLWVTFNLVV